MTTYLNDDIYNSWIRLLQDIELAKNYKMPYTLELGTVAPNPLLDNLLPSLLFVRLVSLLDEALAYYLDTKDISLPKGYKNDLCNRLRYLGEEGIIRGVEELQRVREKRNEIAHQQGLYAIWQELGNALDRIESELQNLNFVGTRPRYESYAEKSQARESTEPDVDFAFDYCYGIKEAGEKVIEVSWTVNVHRSGE